MAEDIFDLLAEQDEAKVKHRDWFDTKKFVLVTHENLDQCIDACIHSGKYALDLETTGLDNRVYDGATKDRIVGVCLSHDGETGWYIPLRHRGDGAKYNVDLDVFDRAFRRLMEATKIKKTIAIFHNAKFDQEFLEFNGREPYGDWDILQSWHDTYLLAWLENSRRKKLGLKGLSKLELDIEQVELEELYPEDHNGDYDFSELDPSTDGVLWYTGGDAICTFLLFEKFFPLVLQKETAEATQTVVYRIEKKCLLSIRWMERNRIHVNTDKVLELIILGQREWLDAVETVYQGAAEILGRDVQPGYYKYLSANFVENDPENLLPQQIMRAKKLHERMYPDPQMPVKDEEGKGWPPIYDMSSSRQLGVLFEEMKVPNLVRTEKTNQVKTSKDVLDMVIDKAEKDFPFMKKIKRFRETHRALVNYLYPMINEIDPNDHTMQINFKQPGTDTGRFATPTKDKSMDPSKQRKDRLGFPKIFMQGIPSKYDPKRPECMNRIREAITPRKEEGDPERFIVAVDFSGVELRIVTNISREPKWMEAYFRCSSCDREFSNDVVGEDGIVVPPPPRCPNCGSDRIGDLHTATGIEIYGEEATQRSDWKNLRGKSKCVHPDTVIWVNGVPTPMSSLSYGGEDTFQEVNAGMTVAGPNGPVTLLETYNGGEKLLYHVVTRRGVVTCTDEHKFQTKSGRLVTVKDGLTEGMELVEPEVVPLRWVPPNGQTSLWGYDGRTRIPSDAWESPTQLHLFLVGLSSFSGGKCSGAAVSIQTEDLVFAGQICEAMRALGLTPSVRHGRGIISCVGDVKRREEANLVQEILPAGKGPCVDIHVASKDHLYLANGLVTHNSLNFAMCYGGGRSAAQRAVGCSLNEGSRIKRKFDGSYTGLSNWWDKQHVRARQKGFVTTVFGRKYPLPDIHNPQGGFRAKAERNSTNGPVQGASADITKLAMGYIYAEFKERGWLSKCRMIITMHDELVFECDADIIEEACERIRYLMCRNNLLSKLKWPIPLTTDCEIGYDWSAPWDLNEIWHKECRFDGDKKLKCPKKDEDLDGWQAWQDNTSYWPKSLEPWFKVKTLLEAEGQEAPPVTTVAPAQLPPPASMANVSLADPAPAKNLKAKTTNGTYTHTLSGPMSGWMAVRLAEVILKVEGMGASRLVLKTQDGRILEGWEGPSPVMINATEFQFWAREKGV